jgi:DNA topoisomerase VI subunit A
VANKKKDFKGDPGGLIGDAIWSAVKPLYREAKKRERDVARAARVSASRIYHAPEPKVSQKDIVFEILPQAITNAGADFNARDLYYASRTLAYADDEWESGKELNYGYFSQTLLTEYQELNGPIEGLWRDPRGNLHEPHTGKSVALGTREVAAYAFPDYVFDKILYVEKEGELSKLKAARLADRYDMAIGSGKGQPTEAVRTLFERAEGGDYQLFVFHDADLDGYDIARVMAEETRRMPGYSVDVVDIGLTVEDALEMGLESEPFYRKKDISLELRMRLSDVARAYLYRRDRIRGGIRGERFELNAILPDTRRIEYIERKLEENGVRPKLIPPDEVLAEKGKELYRKKFDGWVDEIISETLGVPALKATKAEEFEGRFKLQDARARIEECFERDDTQSWRDALNGNLQAAYEAKHKAALEKAVRESVRNTVADDERDNREERA